MQKEHLRGDKTEVPPWDGSNEITGGLQLVCGGPTLALIFALVPQTLSCLVCVDRRFLAHKCIILETKISTLNLR